MNGMHQFVHALAAHSPRAIDHLPRFRARSPLSISRVVRGTWPHVSDTILKRATPITGQHAHEIQPFGHLVRMPIALSEHACKETRHANWRPLFVYKPIVGGLGHRNESRSLRSRLTIESSSDAQRQRRAAATRPGASDPQNSFRTAPLEDPDAAR
jgi:hypothetical protein